MTHDHQQHHQHGHQHGHSHAGIRVAPAEALRRLPHRVHRLDRRRFLTDLGRSTFAVAILGGMAACSDATADRATPLPPDSPPDSGAARTTPDPSGSVASAPPDANGLRWEQARLGSVSAYVLVRGNEAAIVDTGNPGSTEQIGQTLAALGVTYDDVRHVVLTHHHPDHIGSLPEVIAAAPTAATYAGEADISNITTAGAIAAIGDGDEVFGLQVIATPGHTPGSISVLDTGIGLLIAGDALNGNDDGTALSGPNERFTADMTTANESVAKLAGFDVDAVGMGHGQPVRSGAGALLAALAAG